MKHNIYNIILITLTTTIRGILLYIVIHTILSPTANTYKLLFLILLLFIYIILYILKNILRSYIYNKKHDKNNNTIYIIDAKDRKDIVDGYGKGQKTYIDECFNEWD